MEGFLWLGMVMAIYLVMYSAYARWGRKWWNTCSFRRSLGKKIKRLEKEIESKNKTIRCLADNNLRLKDIIGRWERYGLGHLRPTQEHKMTDEKPMFMALTTSKGQSSGWKTTEAEAILWGKDYMKNSSCQEIVIVKGTAIIRRANPPVEVIPLQEFVP